MGPRTTVVAGLFAGVAAALALLLAAVVLLPEPAAVAGPTPTLSAGPSDTAATSASPGQGASGAPASAGPSPLASIAPTAFHVGQPAPALELPQLGGGTISLAALKGRPVWVNFMQTICPPCVDEFPVMNGFAARYASTGLVVVAIDVREDVGTITTFVQSLNTAFPVGLDADGAAATRWDAVALPVHFWIDANGIIRAGALGGIGPDIMARNLATILPGVTVTP